MPIQWLVHYRDQTCLPQYNEHGENKYTDIDRTKLEAFSLIDGDHFIFTVHFDHPHQRLIYRRRVFLMAGFPEPIPFIIVGWQRTIGGENVQSISVINTISRKVDVIGAWYNNGLFDSVEMRPEELATPQVPIQFQNGHHNI